MPSRSAERVLVSSTLVLLLLATTAASASSGDAASSGNVTAIVTGSGGGNNSSATAPADGNGPDSYTCYVCAGRNLMMMKWCPIYWDECHLNCGSDVAAAATSATATSPVPHAGRGLVSAVLPTGTLGDAGDDDECYVMKLYDGNRYVFVQILKCGEVKFCFLTCGGGEVRGAGNALPAAAVPPPAASQRPRLADADFQRCGDQAAMAWARGAVHRGA